MQVEIKKNSRPDLWSALRSPLTEQYTNRAPKTDSYGIYLVFWYGELEGHRAESPPFGKHPVDAPELKEEANRHRKKPVKSRPVSSTKAGRHEQREKLMMGFVCIRICI